MAHLDVDAAPGEAIALSEEHGPFATEPHTHARHQLLYATRGTMQLAAEGRRWVLSPERAAWIGGGIAHEVSSATGVALRAVYFAPELFTDPRARACRVLAVPRVGREMLAYTERWDARHAAQGAARGPFLRALAALVVEWWSDETRSLPEPTTASVARAARYVREHLEDATPAGAARAAALSERTLARRFEEELGMSFRDYRAAARLVHAMERLAEPGASVTAAAFEAGYRSLPAFSAAFREWAGETPSAYRARVCAPLTSRPAGDPGAPRR